MQDTVGGQHDVVGDRHAAARLLHEYRQAREVELVQLDARDLNYSAYFSEGDELSPALEDFHSHNAERLDKEGIKQLLLTLDEVRAELAFWKP